MLAVTRLKDWTSQTPAIATSNTSVRIQRRDAVTRMEPQPGITQASGSRCTKRTYSCLEAGIANKARLTVACDASFPTSIIVGQRGLSSPSLFLTLWNECGKLVPQSCPFRRAEATRQMPGRFIVRSRVATSSRHLCPVRRDEAQADAQTFS